ncbi:GAF domain-containing protein [candidate division TA06 bacterium]|nr:GAF domain-containing protein [candidate division TA06 bacterium]
MGFETIVTAIAALINLVLVLIALNRWQNPIYRAFILMSTSLFVWNFFATFRIYLQKAYGLVEDLRNYDLLTPGVAESWYLNRLENMGAVFIASTALHFTLNMIDRKDKVHTTLLKIAYLISFLLLLSLATDFYPSLLWSQIVTVFMYPLLFYSLYLFLWKYRSSPSPLERNRLRYILSGGVVAIGGGLSEGLSNFDIPTPDIANIANAFYALIILFAITRHRLLDIQIVFHRALNYFILVSLLAGIFIFISSLGISLKLLSILVLFTAGLIILFYQPLKEKVRFVSSQLVLRGKYDYQKTLRNFAKAMDELDDVERMLQLLLATVKQKMGIERAFLVRTNQSREYGVSPHLTRWFENQGNPLVREELESEIRMGNLTPERRKNLTYIHDSMKKEGVEVAVPLYTKDRSMGILILGVKTSRDIFTGDDLALLSLLANQAGSALRSQEMQEEIRRADRLRSLGEMATGIAHEIRNPLGSIKGSAQILQSEVGKSEFLNIIVEEVDRLDSVVSEFLDFARPMNPKPKPEDIENIIHTTLQLIEKEGSLKSVKVEKSFSSDLPYVLVDKGQMKQVFLNLFQNAIQAMPGGGELEITGRCNPQTMNLVLQFTDTGSGIPESDLRKIFEPFFTTKEKGIGLGLSIVQRIIEAHKGTIQVESQVGKGTTFTITLPISNEK